MMTSHVLQYENQCIRGKSNFPLSLVMSPAYMLLIHPIKMRMKSMTTDIDRSPNSSLYIYIWTATRPWCSLTKEKASRYKKNLYLLSELHSHLHAADQVHKA